MERAVYEVEAEVERDHWWFRGRRRILSHFLDGLSPALPTRARVLDVGCGTGANGPVLAERAAIAIGIDASAVPLGLRGTGTRGHTGRLRGDAGRLPFADAAFDLVVALDVLEHLDDDQAAAHELFRVLRPGGVLVVFVPALRLLWGLQDEVAHHRRRYHRPQIETLFTSTGFTVERLTFFNSLLFVPILGARWAMRLAHRLRPGRTIKSENEIGGRITNELLAALFAAEAPVLDRMNLPVGVSLACIGRRPDR